jgi:hypothetical protein
MPSIDIKRLIHLNPNGRLQRTVEGDIVNIGGTSNHTFTVDGRGLLFDDGSSTHPGGSGGGSGVSSINLQGVYNNQHDSNGKAIVTLNTNQDLTFRTSDTLNHFTIDADTGNITFTGLLNGIDLTGLAANVSTHTSFSSSAKHMASEVAITPILAAPSATNVQQVLDQLNDLIVNVSGNAGFGMEHVQLLPATQWIISHNKNTKRVHWTLWDEDDEMVMPDRVKLIDSNTMHVFFGSPQAGRIVLMTF